MVLFYTIIFSYWSPEICQDHVYVSFYLFLYIIFFNILHIYSLLFHENIQYPYNHEWSKNIDIFDENLISVILGHHFFDRYTQQHLVDSTDDTFYCHYLQGMAKTVSYVLRDMPRVLFYYFYINNNPWVWSHGHIVLKKWLRFIQNVPFVFEKGLSQVIS